MQENPYAPPTANLIDEEKAKSIVLASRWKRLWAALIDGSISMIIILPLMYFTGGFESVLEGKQPPLSYTASIGLVGILAFIAIHGKLLAGYGQTIGKRLLGIRITDLEGNLPTIKRHILPRYAFTTLVAYIPVIGSGISIVDVLFIFGKSRRCLHDHVGRTIVVDK